MSEITEEQGAELVKGIRDLVDKLIAKHEDNFIQAIQLSEDGCAAMSISLKVKPKGHNKIVNAALSMTKEKVNEGAMWVFSMGPKLPGMD